MGAKRGRYQTEKQKLQAKCGERGIEFATRWGVLELKQAIAGKRKPAAANKANTNRPTPPGVCLPAVCVCGAPIAPLEVLKNEIRHDARMFQATPTHYFDGVIFCHHQCGCGQRLVVKIPYRSRSVRCACKRPAVMWDKEGTGTCAHCAGKD